jgi:hypothetical protein
VELTAKATQGSVVQRGQQRVGVGQRIVEWAKAIMSAAEGLTQWADRRADVMLRLGAEIRGPLDMTG